MNQIKFLKHCVKGGELKARVWYSTSPRVDGRICVSVNDKDYGHALQRIFAGVEGLNYSNDTDSMTDYFDKGTVRIFEGHPLYAAALAAAGSR